MLCDDGCLYFDRSRSQKPFLLSVHHWITDRYTVLAGLVTPLSIYRPDEFTTLFAFRCSAKTKCLTAGQKYKNENTAEYLNEPSSFLKLSHVHGLFTHVMVRSDKAQAAGTTVLSHTHLSVLQNSPNSALLICFLHVTDWACGWPLYTLRAGPVVLSSPAQLVAPVLVARGTLSITTTEIYFEVDEDDPAFKRVDPKVSNTQESVQPKFTLGTLTCLNAVLFLFFLNNCRQVCLLRYSHVATRCWFKKKRADCRCIFSEGRDASPNALAFSLFCIIKWRFMARILSQITIDFHLFCFTNLLYYLCIKKRT